MKANVRALLLTAATLALLVLFIPPPVSSCYERYDLSLFVWLGVPLLLIIRLSTRTSRLDVFGALLLVAELAAFVVIAKLHVESLNLMVRSGCSS